MSGCGLRSRAARRITIDCPSYDPQSIVLRFVFFLVLLGLRFVLAVLFVFLRQDESLDSPCLARVGESRFDNALHPIMGQAILPV